MQPGAAGLEVERPETVQYFSNIYKYYFVCRLVVEQRGRRQKALEHTKKPSQSSIGRPDKGIDEAQARGWTVVSMKDDWKTISPPETK